MQVAILPPLAATEKPLVITLHLQTKEDTCLVLPVGDT